LSCALYEVGRVDSVILVGEIVEIEIQPQDKIGMFWELAVGQSKVRTCTA
jgi:hypothetical protein